MSQQARAADQHGVAGGRAASAPLRMRGWACANAESHHVHAWSACGTVAVACARDTSWPLLLNVPGSVPLAPCVSNAVARDHLAQRSAARAEAEAFCVALKRVAVRVDYLSNEWSYTTTVVFCRKASCGGTQVECPPWPVVSVVRSCRDMQLRN